MVVEQVHLDSEHQNETRFGDYNLGMGHLHSVCPSKSSLPPESVIDFLWHNGFRMRASSSANERSHGSINNPKRESVPESSLNQNIAELNSNIPEFSHEDYALYWHLSSIKHEVQTDDVFMQVRCHMILVPESLVSQEDFLPLRKALLFPVLLPRGLLLSGLLLEQSL
ncbi:hypothetical protein A6R68_01117 [Neotoma lepida]|uniref:Uncharacterized protein n=1 Tax=Neotoma lepida TaxID=56216 RepID=A0A1A6GYC4_NEOLE|nr:hypothetical protein A6R68_01117 [Neotoma lepida]